MPDSAEPTLTGVSSLLPFVRIAANDRKEPNSTNTPFAANDSETQEVSFAKLSQLRYADIGV
ncbi:hypothetical protein [Pelagibius sp. Alg239-R121]|uniref:hypothetical protein n=1 Tax=Pelagibius sp. Alg239-R121 TaxID=2993448 RepID=UPI0024A626B1|nr:hypothetical protein [Pelagibius sp. Alg239-R121]